MENELLTAVGAGLGGMLGWGLADFFAKQAVDEVGSIVSLVWAHLFGTAVLLLATLFKLVAFNEPIHLPSSLDTWGLLACFGVLQAAVYFLAYQGFGKGQLAVLNPVFASYSGLVAILSIAVFSEVLSLQILVALVAIYGGILLLNLDPVALAAKRLNLLHVPGLKEVALASLLAACWTISWDRFVSGQDWVVYALVMYAFMTLAVLVAATAMRTDLTVPRPEVWKFLFLIGLCETAAYASISLGYSSTSLTSVVALVSGAFSLPTIVLARLVLKERVGALQTSGTLVIVAGVLALSAGR